MIAAKLRGMGLKPQIEEFEIWSFANPQARVEVVEPYKATIEASALGLSGTTPPEGIGAPLKYVETGAVEFLHDVRNDHAGIRQRRSQGLRAMQEEGGAPHLHRPRARTFNLAVNSFQFERFGKLPGAWIRYQDGPTSSRKVLQGALICLPG